MPPAKKRTNYVLTWNNYPQDWCDVLKKHCKWFIAGVETAPTTGTAHIQGAILLNEERSKFQTQRTIGKCYVTEPRGNVQSQVDYCTKGGDFTEWGPRPSDLEWPVVVDMDWKSIRKAAEDGDWAAVPDEVACTRINSLVTLHNLSKRAKWEVEDLGDGPWGVYVWGPPGVGKSYWVRQEYKDLMVRGGDAWWDGYTGQEYVLFDDFDREQYLKIGGQKIKTLVDRYPYPAKFRHRGEIMIRPKLIVFTSNYSPQYVFGEEWKNMERRFEVKEIKEKMF